MSDKSTKDSEEILVSIVSDEDKSEAAIVTSYNDTISKFEETVLTSAIKDYDRSKSLYSVYTSESTNSDEVTPSKINELANGIQNSLTNTITANTLIRRYIITDDIIGKTYESIESNVNTEFRLSYGDYSSKRNKAKKLADIKNIVDQFHKQINLKHLIRESIPITYAEGTYILCLRSDGNGYVVDHYPLGVAYISDYTFGGEPVVCIDIDALKTSLQKTYEKDKKNKAIFFENIEKEIQANYPPEVYTAYKNRETKVRLDTKYAKVMRIGNMGRKYGVSPFLRALKSAIMLENYDNTDYDNTKAKSKKIIHQIMRREAMGSDYNKKGLEMMVYAHNELCKAWKNKTVVYTSCPQVQELKYVESKTEDTNADKINVYRSRIMTTLGINFIDSNNANFSIANISLEQLMKTINAISEQLETILQDWYNVLFEKEKLDKEYLPTIRIIDAEQMSMDMRKSLVDLMYSKLNCSLETSLDILGYDLKDEKQKRLDENEAGISDIFFPRQTSYTSSNGAGRPTSNSDGDKQSLDQDYTKNVR